MGSRTRRDAGCPAVGKLTGEQKVLGVCALHAEAQLWLLERRRNLEKVLGLQWYAQDFRFWTKKAMGSVRVGVPGRQR